MRHLVVLGAVAVLPACLSPAFAEPDVRVSPYLAVYQLRGKTSMQSPGTNMGDPPIDNDKLDLRAFGQDHHREDVGGRVDIGDGFGGMRIDYYRLDMGTARPGTVLAEWGELDYGNQVTMRAVMDELRIGWVEPLVHSRFQYREHPVDVSFGAGGVFAHRNLALQTRNDDYSRQQNLDVDGDLVYAAARARVAWRDWAIDLDYALCPGIVLSGDYDGVQQDMEAWLSYQPQRDIRFFGGYRYSELDAGGTAGPFRYDADLRIDGFQFGVLVTF